MGEGKSGQIHGTIYRVSWSASGDYGSLYPEKRVGYAFAGWYTDAKCTKEYKANMPDQDPNAKTQTADDTGEKPTGIRIPGYPSITIEADKKDVQMNLMNPEGNPCYFTFEIVLNDTDETIYTSKMVEP